MLRFASRRWRSVGRPSTWTSPAAPPLVRLRATVSTDVAASGAGLPPITQTNRAATGMKKFWKSASIQEDGAFLIVQLDKRSLRTPDGKVLKLPRSKRLAATLVAQEWENQDKLLKTYTLPMTSLVSRAIDGLSNETARGEVRDAMMKYLSTDALCFHNDRPPALVRLQAEHWEPLIDVLQKEFGIKIKTHRSIFGSGQDSQTVATLQRHILSFDQWQLAAFERCVFSTKSFLMSLALVTGRLSVEEACVMASVEVQSQIETWGLVEDTHDVDECDIRRQLGSAASLLVDS